MYVLYSAALALALLLSSPWWLLQMLRHGKYRAGLTERLGRVPARLASVKPGCIWVHAVSVGEVLACTGLLAALRSRFPQRQVFISTTTAAGQTLARQRFGAESVFYFPLDFRFAIRPWLRALRPELIVLAETELWPNFLSLSRQHGARIAVVNARISDRSLPRYVRFRAVLRHVLAQADLLLAQTEEDRRRLLMIGALPERIRVTGNLKFEVAPPAASPLAEQLRQNMRAGGAGPVMVYGSTVAGEEPLLLPAFRAILHRFPRAVMILAPRHPERFAAVADFLSGSGIPFQRRSAWQGHTSLAGQIFLLDSIGELASLYALAEVAFVGGSLVPRGGHNILEPAQAGAAVLTGPHTENFRDIVAIFHAANAVRIVTPDELAATVVNLLTDDATRSELGRRARQVVRSQSGATARTLEAIENLLLPPDRDPGNQDMPSNSPSLSEAP
ncbi:MAG: 3-deoxy-D-manno-octulosonic acid transferase [Candidatus Korobacteraceae bacterium]